MLRPLLLLLMLGTFRVASSPAEQLPYRTIRQLYGDAALVVVADVVRTERTGEERGWSDTRAVLRVRSILKGSSVGDEVEVYFCPGLICPAPESYEAGMSVLAFLAPREGAAGYSTCSLAWGARVLDWEAKNAYVRRLQELKALLPLVDGAQRDWALKSWLMRCLASPATRPDALLDLEGIPDYDLVTETPRKAVEPWRDLSGADLRELAALLQTPIASQSCLFSEVPRLLRILAKRLQHPELIRLAQSYQPGSAETEELEVNRRTREAFVAIFAAVAAQGGLEREGR